MCSYGQTKRDKNFLLKGSISNIPQCVRNSLISIFSPSKPKLISCSSRQTANAVLFFSNREVSVDQFFTTLLYHKMMPRSRQPPTPRFINTNEKFHNIQTYNPKTKNADGGCYTTQPPCPRSPTKNRNQRG